MFLPGCALGMNVVQKRLERVESGGVSGFGSLPGFELFPKLDKLFGLVFWQQPEESGCSFPFTLYLANVGLNVVNKGVSSVYLNNVVDEHHLDNTQDVQFAFEGVFLQDQRKKADMPGMLGGVLVAGAIDKQGLAIDAFQLVDFKQKVYLLHEM